MFFHRQRPLNHPPPSFSAQTNLPRILQSSGIELYIVSQNPSRNFDNPVTAQRYRTPGWHVSRKTISRPKTVEPKGGGGRTSIVSINVSLNSSPPWYQTHQRNPQLTCFLSSLFPVPPLFITMQGLRDTLTAGIKTQVSCLTAGSRPAPSISWTKGTSIIRGSSQTVSWNN